MESSLSAGTLGLGDQAVLSLTNLAIGLVLARELEPAAFGVYVVAFAVSLVGSSVQISLITDPLVVLGAPRTGGDQSRYFAALAILQVLFSLGLAAIVGLVALAISLLWGASSMLPVALAGVALALAPTQMQVFFRAVFFARLRTAHVFWNDLIFSALRLGAIAALILTGHLTVFLVFLSSGLSALAATGIAALVCRDLFSRGLADIRGISLEHWRYGRWLLATSGAYWCSGQAPVLLAAGMLTPVAAAILRACQYMVAPINVAFTGLDGVLVPRASRTLAASGREALDRFLRLFAMGAAAVVVFYSAALLPAAPATMELIYKGRYSGYTPIVAILMLDALFLAVARAPVMRFKVLGDTHRIFIGYAWAAGVGLSCMVVLAPAYGLIGAALAAPVSSAVLVLYLGRAARASRGAATTPGTVAVAEP